MSSPFRVKGVAYRGALEYVDEAVPGGRAALIDALETPALRDFASQTFVAGGWYDVLPFVALDTASARITGTTVDTFIRNGSTWQARRELTGIYKVFIKLLGASTVANILPRLAAQYYDFVTIEVESESKLEASVSYSGIPEELRSWLPTVGLAYLSVALELAGMRDVRFAQVSVDDGGERAGHRLVRAKMRVRWSR